MLLGLVSAMLITVALLDPLIRLSHQHDLLVYPDRRRAHARAVPQIGGVAIFIGFLLPCIMFAWSAVPVAPYLVAVSLVMAVGLYDDLRELPYQTKLVVHVLAATLLVWTTDCWQLDLQGINVQLGWTGGLLSCVLLVGMINAVNLSDGLDGLAAGLSLMSALVLAGLAYTARELLPLAITVPLVGGLIGFLRFNAHPARIFMGDNGAYFLGLTLAYAALLLASADAGFSFIALLFVLGVPVYDTLSVFFRRLLAGGNPFSADRTHIHHRFLQAGLNHDQAVLAVYLVHVTLIGLGLLNLSSSEWVALLLLLSTYLGLEWLVRVLVRQLPGLLQWRMPVGLSAPVAVAPVVAVVWLFGYPIAALWALGEPRLDLALAATAGLVMCAAWLVPAVRRKRAGQWTIMDQAPLYLLGAFAVYLCSSVQGLADTRPLVAGLELLWLAVTTCAVVLLLVTRRDSPALKLTALDVLVLLCVAGSAMIGDASVDGRSIGLLKLIVWFYAAEALLAVLPDHHSSAVRALLAGSFVYAFLVFSV